MSSFRPFETSITLLVKKYFLMSLLQVGLTSFRQLPRVTLLDKLIDQEYHTIHVKYYNKVLNR